MSVCSRHTASRYFWGEGCEGWHLLDDPKLSVIEELVPAGACEINHHHVHARQFFYVLDGQAVIEVNGVAHSLSSGEGLQVPPGVPHQFRNDSLNDVRVLVISSPHSHGDRVEDGE